MKVLGLTGRGNYTGYIVAVSQDELARMAGFYSAIQCKMNDLDEGAAVNIGEIYNDAKNAVESFGEIQAAASTMKGAATRIQKFAPVKNKK